MAALLLSNVKMGRPAQSALAHAGIHTWAQLQNCTAAQLLALHGFGPKALGILREEMARQGIFLKGEQS